MNQIEFQRILQNKKTQIVDILQQQIQTLNLQLEDYHILKHHHKELEQDFENNVKVIEELEEENQKIRDIAYELNLKLAQKTKQYEQIQLHLQDQRAKDESALNTTLKLERTQLKVEQMKEKIEKLQKVNRQITNQNLLQKQQLESKHKLELEKISQIAAQTIAVKESQQQKTYYSLKAESQKIISDLKLNTQTLLSQNKVLNLQNVQLKEQIMRVSEDNSQKEHRLQRMLNEEKYNAEIYEKQLDNQKASHQIFQKTLQAKIEQLQKEKEKLILARGEQKQKRKMLKDQANKRMEDLVSLKDSELHKAHQAVTRYELELSKAQYTIQELRKDQLELQRVKRSRVKESEQKNNVYVRVIEQDKRALRNQIAIKDSKLEQLNNRVRQLERETEDQRIVIDQLKAKQMIAQNRQKENQKINKKNGDSDFSVRESQFQYQKKFPQNSLELVALRAQVQSLKDQSTTLNNQNQQLRRKIIQITNKIKQDLQMGRQRLDLKEKQIKLAQNQLQLAKYLMLEKDSQIQKLSNQIRLDVLGSRQMDASRKKDQQIISNLKKQLQNMKKQQEALIQQIDVLNEERQTLIHISNQLRAELQFREPTPEMTEPMKRISISNISKISDEPRNIPMSPTIIEVVPEFKQKRGGALINLIKQKKQKQRQQRKERQRQQKIEVIATQSALYEHAKKYFNHQTTSQIEQRSKLKSGSRSKSPQQAERDSRKKNQETSSQKQIFQEIKRSNEKQKLARQRSEAVRRPANYNQLKEEHEERERLRMTGQQNQFIQY